MAGWNKDSDNEPIDDEHYSHLKSQGSGILGEKSKIPFIIIGAGVICLIVLFFILNPRPPQNKYPDIRPLENQLEKLEERMNKLESLRDQVKNLQDQVRIYSENQALQQELSKKVESNAQAVTEIQKELASMGSGTQKPEKPQAVAPAHQQQSSPKVEAAQKTNQNEGNKLYHTVEKGETLFRISQKYGLTLEQIKELNGADLKEAIYPGQKLIVGPAKKQ